MSYTSIDTSAQDGEPIWLYRFARGVKTWRFTSDASDYVADDGTYLSVAGGLNCRDIECAADKIRNNPECVVSREHAIAELFRVAPPTDVISVVAREVHRGDNEYVTRFVGDVSGCKWDGGKATLQFVSIIESANMPSLKLAASKTCQAMLFGPGCNLDSADWEHTTTITAIDGTDVTVADVGVIDSESGSLPYPGGEMLIEDDDGNIDRRMIEFQDGTTLTLTRRLPPGVIATDAVTILPGCNRRIDGHCQSVYDNTDNFRGLPHLSGKNPMGGNAIF